MTMKEEFTAIDMATAAADGFRAGQRAAQSAPPASPEGRVCPRYVCRTCKQETRPPEPYKAYVLCDCGYMTSATTALAAAPPAAQDVSALAEALEHARLFIRNGIDLGYIKMPEADTPDPAHDTLPKIDKALAAHRQAQQQEGDSNDA